VDAATKERGFESSSAFVRNAIETAIRGDQHSALNEAEQRILATLDRMGQDVRSVRKGQQALFTFVDSLVKILLTCIPEPIGDTYSQAVARGKSRYDRFLKSVGAGMTGDSQSAMAELFENAEK
jgi:hypothetical protein